MKKYSLLIFITLFVMSNAFSQTLFTYGNNKVDAKEFLKAYSKNNSAPVTNKAKSINDYLDLYIKSRLKIREAYDRRYDTLPQIAVEVNNLREQIIDNYMTEPEVLNRMTKEAFQRSQKDVRAYHIYISFKDANGVIDTVAAQKKRDEILQRLKKGEDFALVAQQNSDDPAAKTNKGDLGFITAFTLPYEFENAIYNTALGKASAVYTSKIGYHIFKKTGERNAMGTIKVQQIMLSIPPDADAASKKELASLADSIYKRLLAGDDFSKMATQFSNDYISAATGGNIPDISVGQYDPAFENALWLLPKDNAISKPFLTSHGWHIIKRISRKPVITDPGNKLYQQELQQKIKSDNRWKGSNDFIYDRIAKKGLLKKQNLNDAALWAYGDSLLDQKPMTDLGRTINENLVLFTLGNAKYTVNDWINYSRSYRFRDDGLGAKPYPQVRDEFLKAEMVKYYRDNLEDFNPEFRDQMAEFKDGNLFFEIMQQEIWNKAQNDTTALEALYKKNNKNYTWKQSADAIVFFCADQNTANVLYNEVKKNPARWQQVVEQFNDKVVTDSARYEWSQLPSLNKTLPKEGMLTNVLVNTNDNTATFAYIIKTYPQPTQRSFNEAKGQVINDYQEILEKEWNDVLMKKYTVVIDQKVLTSISK